MQESNLWSLATTATANAVTMAHLTSDASADLSVATVALPGLAILPEFITEDEESAIAECNSWEQGSIARRVAHYGRKFDYRTLGTQATPVDASTLANPIVGIMSIVCKRVSGVRCSEPDATTGLAVVQPVDGACTIPEPDQITVNEYLPGTSVCVCARVFVRCMHSAGIPSPASRSRLLGQGIAPHVDTHSPFGEFICSLSLCADIVMDFRHKDDKVSVLLPRRSLLVLSGVFPSPLRLARWRGCIFDAACSQALHATAGDMVSLTGKRTAWTAWCDLDRSVCHLHSARCALFPFAAAPIRSHVTRKTLSWVSSAR